MHACISPRTLSLCAQLPGDRGCCLLTIYIIPTSAGSSAQNMDESNAEGLPPGAAESVSIDTAGWDLYAENGTELHCLSVCGQLFNSHSLEYAINTDWQEQLASPRDTRDQESSTRVLLLPPPMGRESLSSSTASGAPSSTTFVWCSELHDLRRHDPGGQQHAARRTRLPVCAGHRRAHHHRGQLLYC